MNYQLSCIQDPQKQENFVNIANNLAKWFCFMLVLHIILIIAIIIEFIKRIYTRRQFQTFQILQLSFFLLLQIGAVASQSSFIAGKVNDCLEFYRIEIGFGYALIFMLSSVLCYIYFTTAL